MKKHRFIPFESSLISGEYKITEKYKKLSMKVRSK